MMDHPEFEKLIKQEASMWFKNKGFETHPKHSHSLPDKTHWRKNIILPEVADYIESEGFVLHRYFHNGASSQAMAFNLVAPLRKDPQPLQDVLVCHGISVASMITKVEFEYQDSKILNDSTSVDIVLFDANQYPSIFIEVKLKEEDLQDCSQVKNSKGKSKVCDENNPSNNFELCALHNKGILYWQKMQKHNLIQGDILNGVNCVMARKFYQFFRNILFALEHDGVFVLLCDERNPKFYGDDNLFDKAVALLPARYHNRVARITVQELIAQVDATGHHEWIAEFKQKYGLSA